MNNFTIKAQEAIQNAHHIAIEYNQQQVDCSHLMLSLATQEEGVVLSILKKLEVDVDKLKNKVDDLVKHGPRPKMPNTGQFAEIYITPLLQRIILRATKEAHQLKDEYISTEHLLLSLLSIPSSIKDLLKTFDLDYDKILKVLSEVRGSERVTEPEPESKYQALEKYSINLTEMARHEKLDPIIGRDDEIRRVIQILSRRTKNNPVLVGEAGVEVAHQCLRDFPVPFLNFSFVIKSKSKSFIKWYAEVVATCPKP